MKDGCSFAGVLVCSMFFAFIVVSATSFVQCLRLNWLRSALGAVLGLRFIEVTIVALTDSCLFSRVQRLSSPRKKMRKSKDVSRLRRLRSKRTNQ